MTPKASPPTHDQTAPTAWAAGGRWPTVRAGRLRLTALAIRRRPGLTAFGAVFFVIGLVLAVAPWGLLARDARIERDGVRTTAAVSTLDVRPDSDGGDTYVVGYLFLLPDGARVENEVTVDRVAFRSVEVGDPLRVVYDPDSPSDGFPTGNGNGLDRGRWTVGAAALFSVMGVVFAALGGLFLWGLLVRLPGVWARLLAEGMPAEGRVTDIERATSQARLHYAFQDRFGRPCEGETEWCPLALVASWSVGDRGLVRYDRRDASESVWLGRGDLDVYR